MAQPSPPASLRIASWNIHKGIGADRRRDLARTTRVIAEIAPDLMALQEADLRFGSRAGLLDLDQLYAETGMTLLPIDRPGPSHGWHGNLILAREPELLDLHTLSLPGLEPRGALISDLSLRGHRLRVIAAHLGLLRSSRRAQSQAILDRLSRLAPLPTVLMGDLNEWRAGPGSPLALLGRHFTLADAVPSFPARRPFLPLDRMMAGPGHRLADLAVHDTPLSRRASDHLPLTARLSFGEGAE
jgi:endonuclease/exonuclease/phosphatase family metal-dependent hydrolase